MKIGSCLAFAECHAWSMLLLAPWRRVMDAAVGPDCASTERNRSDTSESLELSGTQEHDPREDNVGKLHVLSGREEPATGRDWLGQAVNSSIIIGRTHHSKPNGSACVAQSLHQASQLHVRHAAALRSGAEAIHFPTIQRSTGQRVEHSQIP